MLQQSVEIEMGDSLLALKTQLKAIEKHPSTKVPKSVDIYDLCQIYTSSQGAHIIRLKPKPSDIGTEIRPSLIKKELRAAMDNLSIICGKVSDGAGIKMMVPTHIRTKGVIASAKNPSK